MAKDKKNDNLDPERFRSNLLSIISHELNTPLSLILNSISVLEDKFPKEKDYIPMLRRNAERLQKSIENLLELSKADAGVLRVRLSELDLAQFLRQREKALEGKTQGFGFIFDMEDDLPHVCGDWKRLSFVFDCLALNAIKFSDTSRLPAGESPALQVKLSLESLSSLPPGVLLPAKGKRTGMYLVVSLSSSLPSVGESPESFEQLFEPFSPWRNADTRVKEGLGVELAIAKEILLAHEGAIWADIPKDHSRGWTFSFALPLLSRMDELDVVINNRLHTSIGALSKLSLLLLRTEPGTDFPPEARAEVSKALQKILFRTSDSLFWLEDAGELCILMDDCDRDGARRVGERVLEALKESMPQRPFVWATATGPMDGANASELLVKARSRWQPGH